MFDHEVGWLQNHIQAERSWVHLVRGYRIEQSASWDGKISG
jgi:hypothetical protein